MIQGRTISFTMLNLTVERKVMVRGCGCTVRGICEPQVNVVRRAPRDACIAADCEGRWIGPRLREQARAPLCGRGVVPVVL